MFGTPVVRVVVAVALLACGLGASVVRWLNAADCCTVSKCHEGRCWKFLGQCTEYYATTAWGEESGGTRNKGTTENHNCGGTRLKSDTAQTRSRHASACMKECSEANYSRAHGNPSPGNPDGSTCGGEVGSWSSFTSAYYCGAGT